jgi:hypothetical protein
MNLWPTAWDKPILGRAFGAHAGGSVHRAMTANREYSKT